jgi:hypothetical protein
MLTTDATPVISVLSGTFNSVKGLLMLIVGVELGLLILSKIVEAVRLKVAESVAERQTIKAMAKLRAWSAKVGVKLTGDYSPDTAQRVGESEKVFSEMVALANKYGVKITTYKGEQLN